MPPESTSASSGHGRIMEMDWGHISIPPQSTSTEQET